MTLQTPAEIATELNLTGLFILNTDGDTSRYNHADGTSGTITGTPTYDSNSATFAATSYIDTGIDETELVTLFCVFAKLGTRRGGIYSLNSESELVTGLFINNFGIRLNGFIAGSRTSFDNEFASVTSAINESTKEANVPISGFVTWGSGGPARLWEPRRYSGTSAVISGSGVRQALGGNYRIGYMALEPATTQLHVAMIADYAMNDKQQADFFVWASKYLQTLGVYL